MENLPDLVVPFKRKTYERVAKAFSKFAKRSAHPILHKRKRKTKNRKT
jgi:hypothetical protein